MSKVINSKVRLFAMDVDGTLTDGNIYIGNSGEITKAFYSKDGYGIAHLLPAAGIEPCIITGRSDKILEHRCKELNIKLLKQGIRESDKPKALKELLELCSRKDGEEYTLKNAAYIGDDLNDLPVMLAVKEGGGITGCPADASWEIKEAVHYVCSQKGGRGAVREFIDYITQK